MTPQQAEGLARYNVKPKQMEGLSKLEAQKLLGTLTIRARHGLASLNQMATLKKHIETPTNLPFKKASQAITFLAGECGWNPSAEQKALLSAMVSKR